MNKKAIILNGPPGSGKDTAVKAIQSMIALEGKWMTCKHNKFSEGMKKAVHALYGLFHSPEALESEGLKDKPHSDLFGATPREEYIAMFHYLEQRHSSAVLGMLMEQEMRRQTKIDVHLLSDGGRVPEIEPIISYIGAKNLCIIEIHAPGKTFVGDIRGYIGDTIKHLYPKVTVVKVPNQLSDDPLDLELFRGLVKGVAKKFLGVD